MQGDPAFPKVQFPPADLCPLCRAPSLDNVSWQSQVFCSLLAACCSLLAARCWSLAAGCWLNAAPVKSSSLHECCLYLVNVSGLCICVPPGVHSAGQHW